MVGGLLDGISREDVTAFLATIDAGYTCLNDDAIAWDKATWGSFFDSDGAITPDGLAKFKADPALFQSYKDDHAYLLLWQGQFKSWKGFSESYTTETWWQKNFPLAGSTATTTWNIAKQYREDLIKWRANLSTRFGARGFKLSCDEPNPAPVIEGPLETIKKQLPEVNWWGVGAVVVIGGVVAVVAAKGR